MRDDDYIPLSTDAPAGQLIEEVQLALTLKVSLDTAMEESATQVASFLFDRASGSLIVL